MDEEFDPNYYPQPLPSMAAVLRRRLEQNLPPIPPPPPETEEELPVPPFPVPPVPTRQAPAGGGGAAPKPQQAAPVPVVTPAAATPQPKQPSVLDLLRRRMQAQIDDESNQRLREIGIGMLRSESPNFFAALGQGLEAAEAGSRSRMDRLRQIAEAERQAAEQQSQEQYRRDQIEIERQRRANEERRINAEIARGDRSNFSFMRSADGTGVVAVDPRNPSRIIPVPGAMLATDRTAREETALRQNARNQAQMAANQEATRRAQLGQTMSQEDIATFRRTTEEQLLASIGLLPLAGTGTVPSTAGGARPSEVLTYSGPAAPAAPRSGPRISAQPPQQPQ